MYEVTTTDAVVLKKYNVGETNTLITLLSRDLGLLQAAARSTRVQQSKLRYRIEPFTKARFSLVRGKVQWRLTGIEDVQTSFLSATPAQYLAAGRISTLLMRLIQGQEEKVTQLYGAVEEGFASIFQSPREDLGTIECVLVLRVLARLGYVPHAKELEPFVEHNLFPQDLTLEAMRLRPLLIRTINESLKVSGL